MKRNFLNTCLPSSSYSGKLNKIIFQMLLKYLEANRSKNKTGIEVETILKITLQTNDISQINNAFFNLHCLAIFAF